MELDIKKKAETNKEGKTLKNRFQMDAHDNKSLNCDCRVKTKTIILKIFFVTKQA
jgi:hypothetical protein